MFTKNMNNGVIEMLVAMILSGFIGLFVFESGQSPMEAVFYRCLLGSIMLGLYCFWRGLLTAESLFQTQIIFVILGGVALIANWVFLFSSFKYSSISIATTVYHFQPFFLIILNLIFFKEKIKFIKTIWLITAFVGLLLIIELDFSQFANSTDQLIGILMAMAAGFLYAVATLIVKKVKDLKSELVAFIQIALGVFLLLPFVDLAPALINEYQWFNLFLLAFFNTFLMYIIMYRAFAKLNISILSVMVFIYPVTAILVDYVFYDQSLSMLQILGVLIVLTSAFLVNYKKD